MKKILSLLLFIFLLSSKPIIAQTAANASSNKYYIYLHNITTQNLSQATDLLTRITSAKTVVYSSTDSVFIVTTNAELTKNSIEGKVQKNLFPLKKMVKIDSIGNPMPKMANTGNPELDAQTYETEKAKWIAENPETYKELINASQPK
jgi:hypothetical protein